MIYIMGDTHGEFGRIGVFCRRFGICREDVMVILGDAGINFSGGIASRSITRHISSRNRSSQRGKILPIISISGFSISPQVACSKKYTSQVIANFSSVRVYSKSGFTSSAVKQNCDAK